MKITKRSQDDIKIAVQEICPISGNKLGSLGKPIKIKIGKEILFICDRQCAQGQIHIQKKHWKTIHQNFAKAQKQCVVMENVLPKKPKFTIVQGNIFYVCCPPCIKKLQQNPKKYTDDLFVLYEQYLKDN